MKSCWEERLILKRAETAAFDGFLIFNKTLEKKGVAIIEVKSGGVNITQVRAFKDTIDKQEADIGIFVCFKSQITDGMRNEAAKMGKLSPFNAPRFQFITVEDLLEGASPKLPGLTEIINYKAASEDVSGQAEKAKSKQGVLL